MQCFRLGHLGFVVISLVASCAGHAQEICGLQQATYDVIFADSFETPVPGLGPASGTVSGPTLGVTPTVTVTFPAPGILPSPTTAVLGTFTGPDHTGITVNGKIAYVQNGVFLAPLIGVDPGSQTLHVVATTFDGLTAFSDIAVTAPTQVPLVALIPDGNAGFAPFNISFGFKIDPSIQVQSIAVDFDGDGVTDYTTSDPKAIVSHDYNSVGTYRPNIVVTSATLQTYAAERRVIILDPAPWRDRLCNVYGYLRVQLAANQTTNALQAFASDVRTNYQHLVSAMGSQVTTAAGQLGTIASGFIGPDDAHLTVVKQGSGVVLGYPVVFMPDENGVWRIRAM